MRSTLLVLCACGLMAAEPSATPAAAKPVAVPAHAMPAAPVTVRGGLPNVAARLRAGQPVTVVVIGGSITQGGGGDGYVPNLAKALRSAWPKAEIAVHNAGIGGTDSAFGAKRFDRDVLARKPHLVLIEFCVNDGVRDMTQHMERMVHKTWQADPSIDIGFFYTLHRDHLPYYAQGVLPPAASWHERVAEFYGIPSFSPAKAVADAVNGGALAWEAFSKDACHPGPEGYRRFNQVFAEAVPAMLAAGRPGPHALGRSITKDLQVYPPAITVQPLVPAPYVTKDGRTATASYRVPVPGVHWVSEPEFQAADGRALWRVSWMPAAAGGKLNGGTGADRSAWEANSATWFVEDKCFTGPSGMGVLAGGEGGSVAFGFAKGQYGVLRFVAPATGVYAVRVRAARLNMWENAGARVGLNLLAFRWDGKPGEALATVSAVKKDFIAKGAPGFDEEREVKLMAGEELVLVPDGNAPGYLAWSFPDLRMEVGLLAP